MRRGFTVIDGKRFRLTRIGAWDGFVLDAEKIRGIMSTEWIEKNSKPSHKDAYAKVSAVTGERVTKPKKAKTPDEVEAAICRALNLSTAPTLPASEPPERRCGDATPR